MGACLRFLGARNEEDARKRVETHPELLDGALDSMLIGVTRPFRDDDVFEAIRTAVVPSLAESGAQRLRVWSAACSTGDELYSVGALLAQAGLLAGAELLGTDCRRGAIRDAEAFEDADGLLLARLGAAGAVPATSAGVGARLALTEVRSRTRWCVANLLERHEPGPWDIILWRNHAIYLTAQVIVGLYERLVATIRPGGFLVVGKAERPPSGLQLEGVAPCVYRVAEKKEVLT
jgi:chemotaxis methyl-accepting protein methylase